MAGLNFQTQTIINSNLDPDSKSVLFKSISDYKVDGVAKNVLQIKRDFIFVKDNVERIVMRHGYEAKLCKAEIDFTTLLDAIKPTTGVNYCRLDVYLGVQGSEPYIYSTPWTHKGKPFWCEFIVKAADTAKTVADRLAKTIKSNHIFQVDKDLINLTNDGAGKLTLEGANEFQRFKDVSIKMFEADAEYAESVAELGDANIALKEMGANSFGTYSQIIKDLRLPTAANYQWTHVRQVETPVVGAIYNQYIIDYCAPATNEPLAVVGGRMDSHTTHVFWVKNDDALIKAWETALKTIGTVTDVDTKTEVVSPEATESQEKANSKEVVANELTKGVKVTK